MCILWIILLRESSLARRYLWICGMWVCEQQMVSVGDHLQATGHHCHCHPPNDPKTLSLHHAFVKQPSNSTFTGPTPKIPPSTISMTQALRQLLWRTTFHPSSIGSPPKKNLLHMRGEDIWLLACFLSSPKFGHQNLYLSQFIVAFPCSLGGTHDPLNKMTKVCWYISFNISLKTPMFERVAFTTFTYALLDLHAWVSLEAFCRVRFSNLVVIPKCCATMAC